MKFIRKYLNKLIFILLSETKTKSQNLTNESAVREDAFDEAKCEQTNLFYPMA